MRGYKGMAKDMTCRGMQYEVGKSYHTDENIEICKKGFHFCKNLGDVFGYYSHSESRFFEVESSGKIITEGDKSVTSDITILRELKETEVNKGYYYGRGYGRGYDHGNGYDYSSGYGSYGNNDYVYGYGDGYGDGIGGGYGYGYEIHGVLIAGGKK